MAKKTGARTRPRQEAASLGVRARLLARGLDVLFLLSDYPQGAKLIEIAARCELPQATVLRILRTMMDREVVLYSPGAKTYRLGPALLALSARTRIDNLLIHVAKDRIDRLSKQTGETAAIFQRHGSERICIASAISNHDLGYRIEPGQRRSVHSGSGGVVLLANMEAQERDEIVEALPPERRAAVLRQLRMLAASGTVVSQDEVVKGVTGIAAPIFDSSSELIASLAVIGPTARFDAASLEVYRDLVTSQASEISHSLGFSGGRAAEKDRTRRGRPVPADPDRNAESK